MNVRFRLMIISFLLNACIVLTTTSQAINTNIKPQSITYITDDNGGECVDFIIRHVGRPFFFYASLNAPHPPIQALEKDLRLFQHIEVDIRMTHAAKVYRLEANKVRIVEGLKKQKVYNNTVVLFFDDNGGYVNVNGSVNVSYRGRTWLPLGGIHVPFLISWPGYLPERSIYHVLVSSLDLAPTFLSIVGAIRKDENRSSGKNLMPFLSGQ